MNDLAGCRVVYTREKLNPDYQNLGAEVVHLPLMATRPLALSPAEKRFLKEAEVLFFTSQKAVEYLPNDLNLKDYFIVTIGQKTAEALPKVDLMAPPPFDSEALLRVWQPYNQKIAILCAPDGRNVVLEALADKNEIKKVYLYQRFNPSKIYQPEALPHLITIASVQTLNHLLTIAPETALKRLKYHATIAGISPRVAQYAKINGFLKTISAEIASEEALFQSIVSWWQQIRSKS